jgi:hypothetical protein
MGRLGSFCRPAAWQRMPISTTAQDWKGDWLRRRARSGGGQTGCGDGACPLSPEGEKRGTGTVAAAILPTASNLRHGASPPFFAELDELGTIRLPRPARQAWPSPRLLSFLSRKGHFRRRDAAKRPGWRRTHGPAIPPPTPDPRPLTPGRSPGALFPTPDPSLLAKILPQPLPAGVAKEGRRPLL